MFVEVKINGNTKLLNVDRIVEIEPTGETTNILVTGGYHCQGYNIECSYVDFKKELTELELY